MPEPTLHWFHSEGGRCAAHLRRPAGTPPAGGWPVVLYCAGMSLTKEVWLPPHAERMVAAGFATLNFDYRFFGQSDGQPRRRLLPQAQVTDVRQALTFLETIQGLDAGRIGLFGASLGCSVALATAGVDDRVRATVAVAGPTDLERVWRRYAGFPALLDKVRAARRHFVATGQVRTIDVDRLLADDPATAAKLRADVDQYEHWDLGITYESLLDLFAFRPEAVVPDIRGPVMYVSTQKDELIADTELASAFARTRAQRERVVLEGAEHVDIYGTGDAFEALVAHSRRWFQRWL